MGTGGLALELGMELHTDEVGVIGQLDDLDEVAIGVDACDPKTRLTQGLPVAVVELVAVAMALTDGLVAVERTRTRARLDVAAVRPPGASCPPSPGLLDRP